MVGSHSVHVAASFAQVCQIAADLEIRDDLLYSAFRDAGPLSQVSYPCIRVLGNTDQYVRMVGEEGPPRRGFGGG